MTPAIEVLDGGPLTTVQDLGRPGVAHLGVGTSGACDRGALRRANRLVGNPEGAACLEVTLGGLAVRARGALTAALTGAPGPISLDDRPAAMDTPLSLDDGAVLRVGAPHAGTRTYLAVGGGVAVGPVLGSRSFDVLAALGPPPLRAGDVLPVGEAAGAVNRWARVDVAPGPRITRNPVDLLVVPGPHDDWFTVEALRLFGTAAYTVTPDSNRIGLRLAGEALSRAVPGELPSEGLLPGAVQVPPSGHPTVLLADHPVTGGYPVVAVVRDVGLDAAGQLRPGQVVRFRVVPGHPGWRRGPRAGGGA